MTVIDTSGPGTRAEEHDPTVVDLRKAPELSEWRAEAIASFQGLRPVRCEILRSSAMRIGYRQPTLVPDYSWSAKDEAGHEHAWANDDQGQPFLTNAKAESEYVGCGDGCCDPELQHWWACVFCDDEVRPGRVRGEDDFVVQSHSRRLWIVLRELPAERFRPHPIDWPIDIRGGGIVVSGRVDQLGSALVHTDAVTSIPLRVTGWSIGLP